MGWLSFVPPWGFANSQSSMFDWATVDIKVAAMNQLIIINCLLLISAVQSAFKDFVIGPEYYSGDTEPTIYEEQCMDENAEQDLMTFQDVLRDGIVDTDLLTKVFMQHANRLGMSFDELADLYMAREDDQLGCSAVQEKFNHQERPTWRDVLFN